MVTVKDKVRFVETDMMGVVHHSNYFRWFEMGRVEYLRQAGISLLELMANGIHFPISEVSCKYHSPARFDDYILIETAITGLSKVKMVFGYRVVREADGLLLAVGSTQNAFTDGNGKVIRLPAQYYDKIQAMFSRQPASL